MTWTRLAGTALYRAARDIQTGDPRRRYHNWEHVERLYWHAENTFEMPYDPDLDRAILAHDAIYDAAPDKELRSAGWLADRVPGSAGPAGRHILRTIDHRPDKDNRMVLLDLADMLFEDRIETNFDLIEAESIALHDCDAAVFAAANLAFMTELKARVLDLPTGGVPAADRIAFHGIALGIERVRDLARARLTGTSP